MSCNESDRLSFTLFLTSYSKADGLRNTHFESNSGSDVAPSLKCRMHFRAMQKGHFLKSFKLGVVICFKINRTLHNSNTLKLEHKWMLFWTHG